MIDVSIHGGQVVFEPRGLSRLWTMRRRIVVPLSSIRRVRRAPPGSGLGWWKGWRLPGTHLPGVITAGQYLREGSWEFWDVRGAGERAIEVDLSGTHFSRLVIDVADPDAEVARLQAGRRV